MHGNAQEIFTVFCCFLSHENEIEMVETGSICRLKDCQNVNDNQTTSRGEEAHKITKKKYNNLK